ncbi:MAG: hypothetical protein EPN72_10505 [Nevskiaceae bacterium]|nr:MAG: hypothetical protein EPN63_05515 [Nevskiaceae bacterium]TBR72181.1 MAG: hypothetical protein EPN72_10505 [Nevskiaceae bacterium]
MNTAAPALQNAAAALSRALAAGDEASAQQSLAALTQLAEGQLCTALAAVVTDFHRDLDALPGATVSARKDLPDATERLNHVVALTQQAANQTLDCIEAGQRIAEQLRHHVDDDVRDAAARLRAALRDAAAAQAYQDVTGQLLGQVIKVLTGLRGALDGLVQDAGIEAPPAPRQTDMGPLLPGTMNAASQGDADQLLADLGL